jgi:hypothetical protein
MAQAALTFNRIALLTSDAVRSRWVQGAAIAAFTFAIYLASSDLYDPYNQYERLADAMLHGRLNLIDPPDYLELAHYPDGIYVINPPAPAVLLIPFVAIWGLDTNQVVVSMLVGAAAIGLFWVATRQLEWDVRLSAGMVALLAFGTNFWWASADGAMWMFAHVTAVFFMMGAFVEATGAKRPWLVGLLLGAAGLSRLPVFLAFPFFATLLVHGDDRPLTALVRDRGIVVRIGVFLVALAVMGAVDLLYNYARFGTIEDKGYHHPHYLTEPAFAHGMNSLRYIPRHLEAIFARLPVVDFSSFPYMHPSVLGLGVFFTTPAFLYIFITKLNRLTVAAIAATFLTLVPTVTYGVIGASQFGYRYGIDVYPMLLVLTASAMRGKMSALKWGLIGASCVISLWGVLSFEHFDWVACEPSWVCNGN